MQQAQHLIESLDLLELTADTFARAALLDPPSLRSLDALHLAAALTFGDDLGGMVVYDERLAAAARDRGIEVVAPS
jgi:predicted nucleic acid-binding protein